MNNTTPITISPEQEQRNAEKLRRIKAQVKRLREAADRLEAFTALQMDHKAVSDEVVFVHQVANAIGLLAGFTATWSQGARP